MFKVVVVIAEVELLVVALVAAKTAEFTTRTNAIINKAIRLFILTSIPPLPLAAQIVMKKMVRGFHHFVLF
jgi:hypothetical protein